MRLYFFLFLFFFERKKLNSSFRFPGIQLIFYFFHFFIVHFLKIGAPGCPPLTCGQYQLNVCWTADHFEVFQLYWKKKKKKKTSPAMNLKSHRTNSQLSLYTTTAIVTSFFFLKFKVLFKKNTGKLLVTEVKKRGRKTEVIRHSYGPFRSQRPR